MPKAKARAVAGSTDKFQPITIDRREVGPKDVLIDIKFAGICHSDIHTARQEWREIEYPFVPGHEIAGVVSAVGPEVTKYKVGDHVGVGCLVNSCGECEYCKEGNEHYCIKKSVGTYADHDRFGNGELTQGGYSSQIVVTENFVLRIPDSLALDEAAPLLCAGITTYSPLRHWNAGPGVKVGVLGMGGLGHMAVKLAHAMGAEVTVLSHSDKKREDSATFGADHYVNTSDETALADARGSLDLIINTVSADVDINSFLALLRPQGALVNVGAPPQPLSVNAFALIGGRKTFAGSNIGGIRETQEMLDFCAKHGVTPQIEKITADQIDEAYERVVNSDVRYRFVIDNATL
jgi:alcohol dehydrogenase (NADP+)